jgi:membrane protein YqaA with SNARE-associated domain
LLSVLSLAGVAFVGSVFWVVSTEAAAIYYGGPRGWSAPAVGAVCAAAQTAMYLLLYFFGDWALARWAWLQRRVERTRERHASRLETSYLAVTAVAALTGAPPVLAMVSLASSFGVTWRHVLPTACLGRFVRFTTLAWAGDSLLAWWSTL